jgi:2-hydroxy-3-keto-5-methylthiopentenyl-1-phosphate phosphatase
MDTLSKMKSLMEQISIDSDKALKKGNHSASIRARKNAQELKNLVPLFRKEILEGIKKIKTNA